MTTQESFSAIATLSGLTFVVAGMLGTVASLSVAQVLGPLKNRRLVILALLVLLVTGVGINADNIIGLVGSWGFLALILFVVGSLAIGLLMGGRDPGVRSVLGLGTAQRNVAAAIPVTSLNFPGTTALPFVPVASIILPLILLPTAKRMGRHSQPAAASASPARET